MKGSYPCQACGHRTFFPNTLKKEKKVDGINTIYWESYCPNCDKPVEFEPYK